MKKIFILIIVVFLLSNCTEDKEAASSYKSGYIQITQGKLYYKTYGVSNDTPIIVLHGGPGMLDSSYLIPDLKTLAKDSQVIFYDQRGSGKSLDTPINEQLMTIEQFVKDLEDLRKSLKLNKVILFGHSWGGLLAMNYAIKHPENTEKLILLSTAPADYQGQMAFEEECGKKAKNITNEVAPIYNAKEVEKIDIEEIKKLYRLLISIYVYNPQDASKINLGFNKVEAVSGIKTMEALVKTSWVRPGSDLFPFLKNLPIPTLVIHGKEDIVPLCTAEKIKNTIPNARMVYMDKCGHFLEIEHKEQTLDAIRKFIKESD